MNNEVKSRLIRQLSIDEGYRKYSYRDTRGFRTVGIGFNMDDGNAKTVWKELALPEDFNKVYAGKNELSYESIVKLLNYFVEVGYTELVKIFPEFDTYPTRVQEGLLNMHYQLGNTTFRQFKSTIGAIKNKEYAKAKHFALQSLWAKQTPKRALRTANLIGNIT